MNHLKELKNCGQSIWLDFIERKLLTGGELKRLIEEDGVSGMTSNPAIFEKAITGSKDYEDDLHELTEDKSLDAKSIYERLAIKDIQDAADTLRSIYTATKARDGYVSLEVSPELARDTAGTLEEARRLWKTVDRENIMIKVPGTSEGVPAVRQLISEGININITLLFALSAYEQVLEAYLQGLEERLKRNEDISRVASVASFFVSRIDTMIDTELESRIANFETAGEIAKANTARGLRGKIAVANAKLAYQHYLKIFGEPRWDELKSHGAHTQRLLWASTSTKNPNYRDVLYVEELIGYDTVNTMPPATIDAYRDHGHTREDAVESDLDGARIEMEALKTVDIAIDDITERLLDEAVRLFSEPFNKLLASVEQRSQEIRTAKA